MAALLQQICGALNHHSIQDTTLADSYTACTVLPTQLDFAATRP